MKATGVVRRIDDLGRIVLPKELRRTLRIKEGESLEIFVEGDDSIILKKYSPLSEINALITDYVNSLYETSHKNISIVDHEIVVASSIKELVGKRITKTFDSLLAKRQTTLITSLDNLHLTDDYLLNSQTLVKPINVFGDVLGAVVLECGQQLTDIDKNLSELSGVFISKYLEI